MFMTPPSPSSAKHVSASQPSPCGIEVQQSAGSIASVKKGVESKVAPLDSDPRVRSMVMAFSAGDIFGCLVHHHQFDADIMSEVTAAVPSGNLNNTTADDSTRLAKIAVRLQVSVSKARNIGASGVPNSQQVRRFSHVNIENPGN
jgi:hypothetical protein